MQKNMEHIKDKFLSEEDPIAKATISAKELEKLYTENYIKVQTYITNNGGTSEQAKDIFQESIIIVWENVCSGKFVDQGQSSLYGYLYKISTYKWMDYLRSKKGIKLERLPEIRSDEEFPPIQEMQKNDDDDILNLMRCFNELSCQCSEILTRFYYNLESMREIAAVMGMEESSVRNAKYRCMQRLKELSLGQVQLHRKHK